jgi:transcriptional regulator with XRE-family HTH domain
MIHSTKTKRKNDTLRQLRRILAQSQSEFAQMIGATRDTVASWENGRNRLTRDAAQRIMYATGAWPHSLLNGPPILDCNLEPYKPESLAAWKREGKYCSVSAADALYGQSADALWLVFTAAARPGPGKLKHQFPALWWSFTEWLKQVAREFKLHDRIDALLKDRFEERHPETNTWGEWRKLARRRDETSRFKVRLYRFKDDPKQPAKKPLTLYQLTRPGWNPAGDMRTQRMKLSESGSQIRHTSTHRNVV